MTASKYRHELKIEVSLFEDLLLKSKLDVIMDLDGHCGSNGQYSISSLYFDNVYDKALQEKVQGVNRREKFRLRYYDDNVEFIRLEKKQKVNGLCLKTSCPITYDDVIRLVHGEHDFLKNRDEPLMRELAFKMETQGLRPRNLVRYDRRAYIYPVGNVRVTFDMNISAGISPEDFLVGRRNLICDGDPENGMIMEVKYDEFIPSFIEGVVSDKQGRVQAFSKYAQCRKYI